MNESVQLTLLGEDSAAIPAVMIEVSGCGLRISAQRELPVNGAVKIEMRDAILLAEVCFSTPQGTGFITGLQIDQVLWGLSDLNRLNGQLLDGRVSPASLGIPSHGGELETVPVKRKQAAGRNSQQGQLRER